MTDAQKNIDGKRVFVIENQYYHFKEIWQRLNEEEYDIYPTWSTNRKHETFKEVIDLVRVYLNPRYIKSIRKNALEQLETTIKDFNPNLFIIDYILVGNYYGETGLDLALKLRELGFQQPIVFLSNSEMKSAKVIGDYPKISGSKDWIYKGFAGKVVLEKEYFEKEIIPRLNELLKLDAAKSVNSEVPELIQKFVGEYEFYSQLSTESHTDAAKGLKRLGILIDWLKTNKEEVKNVDDFNELIEVLNREGITSNKFIRLSNEKLN
ncbi:hypothetical protein ABV409_12785 [Flagellimonas sp. DF-77]|uniref:hypothetical protein n=1 Tax=Flagellimonas algarum TaxID=3230298 RepID=UPI003396F03C